MMIKAFLFDNGGVITPGGSGSGLSDRLGENLGITSNKAFALLSPTWSAFLRGKISEAEFWASAEKRYGKPIAEKDRDIWDKWDNMRPIPEMVQFVLKLKAAGYKVSLLSNVILNTEEEIRSHSGYNIFDPAILSCKVGLAKPEKEIYNLALNILGNYLPEEVIYLDDQERFIKPANELGFKTILVSKPAQAISEANAFVAELRPVTTESTY